MKILFTILGLVFGTVIDSGSGSVFGASIGLLFAILLDYRDRLRELERKFSLERQDMRDRPATGISTTVPERTATGLQGEERSAENQIPARTSGAESTTRSQIQPGTDAHAGAGKVERKEPEELPPRKATASTPAFINYLKMYFTTGNVVAKTGMIILFFGLAFLLKYAIDRNALPIELRLSGVALIGIAMLIVGWRIRLKKPAFALTLQGGAVGTLYLTVFTAAKLYFVLPFGLALIVMILLVVFSSLLALLQNSRSLAILGTAGGFLAPVLISTNTGDHVSLFSYYALLNIGILGIAFKKSWRILNWIGFVFTFVIASLWGITRYRPEYFSTTEPFLVLFFLFYLTISVLFAIRQPRRLKGFVDGTLVFGTPLVGFTLQAALVRDFEFGLAISALVTAIIYISLAKILWKKQIQYLRMLTESFLAIGVVFASLAIPFALDGRWTAAAWALEGAGMMWIGVRQDRISPRLFGILLHIGGALAFLAGTQSPRGEMPLLNSTYIGGTLISTCGLWCSHLYYKRREKLTPAEKDLHSILLIWGLIWWFGAAIAEINAQLAMQYELNATIVFVSASLWVLMKTGHKLSWSPAVYPSGFLLPVMYLFALVQYIGYHGTGPVANFGYLAWATAFSCQYLILRGNNPYWNNLFLGNWHCGTFWLGLFVLSWMIDFSLTSKVPGMEGWWRYTWGLIPVLSIHFILNFRNTLSWPLLEFDRFYRVRALYPVTVYLAVWVLAICTTPGDPQPLPYVPVLNPQDIVQLLTMHSIIVWGRQADFKKSTISATVTTRHYWIALAAIAFIWLNSIIARTIHFYYGVRYNLPAMLDSSLFQTSISIVWTLLAFIVMNTASRKTWRQAWIAGAGLLGAVVIKLFIVDLANTGTVTRIISFLSVGGMMLLIGYLSPLPPRAGKE